MSDATLIELHAGDYSLALAPARGGSVARFDYGNEPLFRATCGPSILDTGCFPLVPFSNRIAHGAFAIADQTVRLSPNFPGLDHPHPMHGFGWLCGWEVIGATGMAAVLRHDHVAGEWPWRYRAEQRFDLSPNGLIHSLSVANLGTTPMPAGLGFHPYFPRNAQTRLLAPHRGEWLTADDGLPITLQQHDFTVDWWLGQPVESRNVDTAYTGRDGDITVFWPDRGLQLSIQPSANLPCTIIYTPHDADFFCAEPVSHATNAINRPDGPDPMAMLAPGAVMTVTVRYQATIDASLTPATDGRQPSPSRP